MQHSVVEMRPLREMSGLFRHRGPWLQRVAGGVFLSMVGVSDWLTGPELDFSLFYLLPVGFVSWNLGRMPGYVASVCSAIVWLYVDRLTGTNTSAPLLAPWNMAGRLLFFSGSVYLLTTRKESEKRLSQLVEERTAALRRLAAQLSAAEDAERRKLAYDMHDAVSQTLSIIKMTLDSIQLATDSGSPITRHLSTCGVLVDDVIKQSRTLMFDLHPAMLDDLGLVPTLQWYAAELAARTGKEVLVSEFGLRQTLPAATTNYLFRAIKELAGNAVRHGRAASIIITVHWEPASVRMAVDDDGIGFDTSLARADRPGNGLGLAGIDERLRSMGGRVTVESTTGHGTRVIIEVPIESERRIDAPTRTAG